MRNEKGQFIKGIVPHNKGVFGYSNGGSFKKGHKPLNNALVIWRQNGGTNANKGAKTRYDVVCKNCGKELESKYKKQKYCSVSCGITYANIHNPRQKFKDTKPELRMEELLKSLGVDYKKQISLCKIARVDFYIPSKNLVIQVDGCYWHGCPQHNPGWIKRREKDAKQDAILEKNGIKVIRFWEHEIMSNNFKLIMLKENA